MHTVCDQKLEAGTAWERGYLDIQFAIKNWRRERPGNEAKGKRGRSRSAFAQCVSLSDILSALHGEPYTY